MEGDARGKEDNIHKERQRNTYTQIWQWLKEQRCNLDLIAPHLSMQYLTFFFHNRISTPFAPVSCCAWLYIKQWCTVICRVLFNLVHHTVASLWGHFHRTKSQNMSLCLKTLVLACPIPHQCSVSFEINLFAASNNTLLRFKSCCYSLYLSDLRVLITLLQGCKYRQSLLSCLRPHTLGAPADRQCWLIEILSRILLKARLIRFFFIHLI